MVECLILVTSAVPPDNLARLRLVIQPRCKAALPLPSPALTRCAVLSTLHASPLQALSHAGSCFRHMI